MTGKGAKKAPKKKGAKGYKMPDPIRSGEVLTDIAKKQWIIGPSIGVGGFGEIYSAAPYTGGSPKSYLNVVKIEPHGNGPLFVEMHFYMRNAKSDEIEAWRKQHALPVLGMPSYIGSGSHEYLNEKYRFVVMDRYGTDLWHLFLENGRRFPEHTVYKVALQIINVLEYMHHKKYVHADIKGANLLLSLKSANYVYLVDFGLASHYTTKPVYQVDPKKAHNGTIEYTSRDAHMGIPTMRGDFEILAYNVIQWLCGSLPWEKNLTDPSAVQKEKNKAFEDIPTFLDKCFSNTVPDAVKDFMTLLAGIKYNEAPDYAKFKQILSKGLEAMGQKPDGKLEFKTVDTKSATVVTQAKPKKQPATVITPVKIKKQKMEGVRKSPRVQKVSSATSSKNGDVVSVLINANEKGALPKRRVLKNIEVTDDSDFETEVRITKKRKQKKEEAGNEADGNATVEPLKRGRRKLAKEIKDFDETGSDFETEELSKGTRSRPRVLPKANSVPAELSKEQENDSDKDIFADDEPTPPKKAAKSWKDFPSIIAGKVDKPGEYKRTASNTIKKPRR